MFIICFGPGHPFEKWKACSSILICSVIWRPSFLNFFKEGLRFPSSSNVEPYVSSWLPSFFFFQAQLLNQRLSTITTYCGFLGPEFSFGVSAFFQLKHKPSFQITPKQMPLANKISWQHLPSCLHVHRMQSLKPLISTRHHHHTVIQRRRTMALAVVAALFAALVLITDAHRTIISATNEIIDDNSKQQKCRMQIKRLKLTHCEQYLIERELLLLGHALLLNQEQEEEHLKPCCDQMEKLGTKCRCMGLEQIVEQLREQGEMQGEEVEDMEDCARHLPSDCDLEPHTCKF